MLKNLKTNAIGFSEFKEKEFRKQVDNEQKIFKVTAKEAFLIVENLTVKELSQLLLDPNSSVYHCLSFSAVVHHINFKNYLLLFLKFLEALSIAIRSKQRKRIL
jgi:hypothetical protein